jgi:hypothetical protein
MAMPAVASALPLSARRADSGAEREALRMQRRPQGRAATALMVRRARAAADGEAGGARATTPATTRQKRLPLFRPRQDVLEPDTRLRERLTPRCDVAPCAPRKRLRAPRISFRSPCTMAADCLLASLQAEHLERRLSFRA